MKRKKKSIKVVTSMGGKARAKALSGKRRSAIARHAATVRWANRDLVDRHGEVRHP